MLIQATHCPACGAPISVPAGADRLKCEYCDAALVIHDARVTGQRRPAARSESPQGAPYPEPEVTLSTWQSPRFELSFLEQLIPDAPPQIFVGFELSEQRFAVVWLRVVDAEGRPQRDVSLDGALDALRTSLEADADPGLAANLALEALCERPFSHRLECAVLLFEPTLMRVVPYVAGCPGALCWVSSEEGRTIVPRERHQALERKALRESADHFSNHEPIFLAANDLITFASAGYLHRGGKGYGECTGQMLETMNAHLGEEPLRIATLAKNAFWDHYQLQHARQNVGPPVGPVQVAAVRAVLPPRVTALPPGSSVHAVAVPRFEVAALARAGDAFRLMPLHDERHCYVWLSMQTGEVPAGALDRACAAVAAVLDRVDHGDNDNPRRAGREALAALEPWTPLGLSILQLFPRFETVKWFVAGWRQPLALGPRGLRECDSLQQFDDGGAAVVHAGSRLFFPGALRYQGEVLDGASLAKVWNGGKASRLYEALSAHWKTKKSALAIEAFGKAALADRPGTDLSGLLVVTGAST